MTALITHGKSERDRLAEGEAILSDKVNGMPLSAIMAKYDLSKATVDRRIRTALDSRLSSTTESYREQQNAILDEMMDDASRHREAADALIQLGITTSDAALLDRGMNQRARAMEMKLRTVERRAKLNGLDAPVKVEQSITVTTPLDTSIDALISQLEDSDAPAPG